MEPPLVGNAYIKVVTNNLKINQMKKYIIISSLLVAGLSTAQVAIEKTALRSPEGSILEFNDVVETTGVAKGIILPIVETIDSNTEQGTIYLDATNDKVVYQSETATVEMTPAAEVDLTSPALSDVSKGAVIRDGSIDLNTDTAPAVLKLSSDNKALLLPHVSNTDTVVSPEPGTLVYEEDSHSLAIFNGTNWSFWN